MLISTSNSVRAYCNTPLQTILQTMLSDICKAGPAIAGLSVTLAHFKSGTADMVKASRDSVPEIFIVRSPRCARLRTDGDKPKLQEVFPKPAENNLVFRRIFAEINAHIYRKNSTEKWQNIFTNTKIGRPLAGANPVLMPCLVKFVTFRAELPDG